MLIMVYKSDDESEIDATIVKFSDRIWFDQNGDAKCLRSLIIHVSDASVKLLSKLFLLMPVARDSICEAVDRSETCTNIDFAFNSFKTGGYRVESRDNNGGLIYNDGFENVRVCYGNRIEIISVHNCSVLEVTFSEAIRRGEFREIRLGLSITSLATKVGGTYAIDLPYFGASTSLFDCRKATEQLMGHAQIPVIPIYDREARQGGFDVITYIPPGMEGSDFSPRSTKSIARLDEAGISSQQREKRIWRLRKVTDAVQVCYGDRFSVTGRWGYEIRPVIEKMSESSNRALWFGIVALIVGIISLIVSLVSLL